MTVVVGHVDKLEGRYVTGWAISQPDDEPCEVRLIASGGEVLASGKAQQPRSDLSALGYGRTNFAFRVALPELTEATEIGVFVGDVELAGSPIGFQLGRYEGGMKIADGMVDGWLFELGRAASAPLISLVGPDGRVLGEVQSEADPDGDKLFLTSHFSAPLPAWCFGRDEVEIAAGVGDFVFARARGGARLTGHLDILTSGRCAGWLISPDSPGRRFEIAVWRDGEEVGRALCGDRREDLGTLFPGNVDIGFDITFDKPHKAVASLCEISFRLAGTEVELFGGPFTAGRRAALIAATQAAARKVFDAGLTGAEMSVLRAGFRRLMDAARSGPDYIHHRRAGPAGESRRVSVLMPIYKGVAATRACIESVLRVRDPATDHVLLLNDASPEPAMAAMLEEFSGAPNLTVISNEGNLGFVRTVNRGFGFLREADVLLLNSDTILYPGVIGELWRAAHSSPGIGTATALSNNATIFSYPHPAEVTELNDVSWEELAAAALAANGGAVVDVPTAHGFCMLIKREVLDQLGGFDVAFGRGYGEENEFSLRAADLGYRHVAATGALVRHVEGISFGEEKAALLRQNLAYLNGKFPEYPALVMAYEAADELRVARWALDSFRLRRAVAGGRRFALVVENWLGGGTRKAIADIESVAGYGGADILRVTAREDGMMELRAPDFKLRAVFGADEAEALFGLVADAGVWLVVVHQLLGYGADFIARLTGFAKGRHVVGFVHDFYAACPRVTLIDPTGRFCGVADAATCGRCVALGGGHEASVLEGLEPAGHRALFGEFFAACAHVVAPSWDAALHLGRAFPRVPVKVMPHPHVGGAPAAARVVGNDVALLGAVGPHKGSGLLLELARLARLTHPALRFHVIGYTDIDAVLLKLGNVFITGKYEPLELPGLLDGLQVGIALFLHGWPETFSYTLTEAVMHGLVPLVPDIGAPAERVRASGIGAVYPFPATAREVLGAIEAVQVAGADEVTEVSFGRLVGGTAAADLAGLFLARHEGHSVTQLEAHGASRRPSRQRAPKKVSG